jgi:hypothetical protein
MFAWQYPFFSLIRLKGPVVLYHGNIIMQSCRLSNYFRCFLQHPGVERVATRLTTSSAAHLSSIPEKAPFATHRFLRGARISRHAFRSPASREDQAHSTNGPRRSCSYRFWSVGCLWLRRISPLSSMTLPSGLGVRSTTINRSSLTLSVMRVLLWPVRHSQSMVSL